MLTFRNNVNSLRIVNTIIYLRTQTINLIKGKMYTVPKINTIFP